MQLDEHNLSHIQRLNQRGGRSLSIVDLVDAGTINLDMAALCWLQMEHGSSLLTGAVPGGAGKTTLMAALLAFLPPGEQIATVSEPQVIQRACDGEYGDNVCLLAHEIGSGSWFAYIWGRTAAEFFAAQRAGCRCVTCLHADTPDQAAEILRSCGVEEPDIRSMDLQLFMWMGGTYRQRIRRVNSLHLHMTDELHTLYRWRQDSDQFDTLVAPDDVMGKVAEHSDDSESELQDKYEKYRKELADMHAQGIRDFAQVRRRILDVYDSITA